MVVDLRAQGNYMGKGKYTCRRVGVYQLMREGTDKKQTCRHECHVVVCDATQKGVWVKEKHTFEDPHNMLWYLIHA